jgi:nucleotide-binding universal stress UspA family protein
VFTNIVVGVDGLAAGREALALTRPLRAPGAVLTLANVHGRPSDREASRELLEHESENADDGVKLLSIENADVGKGLHRLAKSRQADLIAVGSCRRGVSGGSCSAMTPVWSTAAA